MTLQTETEPVPSGDATTGRAPDPTSAPVSVVVLTYNEEGNIADCLRSCAWCDDVHVLDSGSTDRTCDIARAMGATVHVNPFRSFGDQRNWAIDHIAHRYEWVFHLDADERFTPGLVSEMRRILDAMPADAGFYVPSKMMFQGRWLRHAAQYPVYQVRLFHRGRLRFTDWGHGQREATGGTLGRLAEPYLHHSFSKGLDDWFDRHNRYSTLEARELFERERGAASDSQEKPSLFGNAVQRRRFLKTRVYPKLPARWLVRFLYTYVLKRGFLDGRPGLRYCQLISAYELMIGLKLDDLRGRDREAATSKTT